MLLLLLLFSSWAPLPPRPWAQEDEERGTTGTAPADCGAGRAPPRKYRPGAADVPAVPRKLRQAGAATGMASSS